MYRQALPFFQTSVDRFLYSLAKLTLISWISQDYEAQVTKSILEVAAQEVERNGSQLLAIDRGKASALIDGALDRSGVYQEAQAVIESLIDSDAIEAHIRELRQEEIGKEAADEELRRGRQNGRRICGQHSGTPRRTRACQTGAERGRGEEEETATGNRRKGSHEAPR